MKVRIPPERKPMFGDFVNRKSGPDGPVNPEKGILFTIFGSTFGSKTIKLCGMYIWATSILDTIRNSRTIKNFDSTWSGPRFREFFRTWYGLALDFSHPGSTGFGPWIFADDCWWQFLVTQSAIVACHQYHCSWKFIFVTPIFLILGNSVIRKTHETKLEYSW